MEKKWKPAEKKMVLLVSILILLFVVLSATLLFFPNKYYNDEKGIKYYNQEDESINTDSGLNNSNSSNNSGSKNDYNNSNSSINQNGTYICDRDYYNCGNFSIQLDSQNVLNYCGNTTDIHGLDNDNDAVACEGLN